MPVFSIRERQIRLSIVLVLVTFAGLIFSGFGWIMHEAIVYGADTQHVTEAITSLHKVDIQTDTRLDKMQLEINSLVGDRERLSRIEAYVWFLLQTRGISPKHAQQEFNNRPNKDTSP